MRAEKQYISNEYQARLNTSPYFIVVDYRGLKVGPITELRKRLHKAGAEMHIVKNSLFRLAVKESGIDLGTSLSGQLAVVTGQRDVSAAAKIVKTFSAEFDKPKVRFGYLKDQRLESADLMALADLPSIEVLRSKLLGVIKGPATKLAATINTPGTQLARVLKARVDKGA
ncbi:MAG TPA: 50S ribosomal protein L10 [Verrucomicrobiae bacterium]|jgi:large subunit ribosomal protein L10